MKIRRKGLYRGSFTITEGKFQQTRRSSCNKLGSFSRAGKTIPFARATSALRSKRGSSKRNWIKADERPFSLLLACETKIKSEHFLLCANFPSIDDKLFHPRTTEFKFHPGFSRVKKWISALRNASFYHVIRLSPSFFVQRRTQYSLCTVGEIIRAQRPLFPAEDHVLRTSILLARSAPFPSALVSPPRSFCLSKRPEAPSSAIKI